MKTLELAIVWAAIVAAPIGASCQPGRPAPGPEPPRPGKGPVPAPPPDPADWVTRAEASDFAATASYEETLAFLRRLEERMPQMKVTSFGTSGQGREMILVILSKDRAFTPREASRTGKPVVLIQSGIHPGEIDGKEACLMILRDLLLDKNRWILDSAILLIVPILNVDGHERVSPWNRTAQDGPLEGMGFRTTAARLDLNRDHIKLVSAEARALIGLFNDWRPHVHVDNHVTDGCDHDWVLTWAWSESPLLAGPVDAWMKEHMGAVLKETAEAGHRNGPYVGLKDPRDPGKGFSSAIRSPRLSTSYFALRNRPSILVETHSYKPFKARVLANRDFLLALLRKIGEAGAGLIDAVTQADAHTVELGRPGAGPSTITLAWAEFTQTEKIVLPIYAHRLVTSIVTGEPFLVYEQGEVEEIEVDWAHTVAPEKTLPRPRGYLLLAGWPQIEKRLAWHGIRVERLVQAVELEVEVMRLENPRSDDHSYQGEIRMQVDVVREVQKRTFPAGTLWIPADQPDFEVAVQLLEPEAPDSLVSWGMLRSAMERMTWIGSRELEVLVEQMLEDPQVEKEWKAKLADRSFASDPEARHIWWYRHTKHWDDHIGLMPAMRVMTPPTLVTEPWKPAISL